MFKRTFVIASLVATVFAWDCAYAGWFGNDPEKEKCPPDLSSFAMHRFIAESVPYWEPHGVQISPEHAIDGTTTPQDVDRYEAYLKLVRENVATLDTECLRAAYGDVLDTEGRLITKVRKAIEFAKTRSPVPSGS